MRFDKQKYETWTNTDQFQHLIPTLLIDFFKDVELMERGGAIKLIIDRAITSKGSSHNI